MHTILMSSPKVAYNLEYKINPWMDPEINSIDKERAICQWSGLTRKLISLDVSLDIIEVPHPDGVFSANAGLVYKNHFILSNFLHPQRQCEDVHWLDWARNRKRHFDYIHIIREPFEGAGDALFVSDNVLLGGWGFRTSRLAYLQIETLLQKVEIIPVKLIDPRFYHLDTCCCPLTGDQVMFFPNAFENPEHIRDRFETIEIPEEEATRFACNAIVVDKNIVLPSNCPKTIALLEHNGYTCHPLEMTEFILTGGACKCLTLKY